VTAPTLVALIAAGAVGAPARYLVDNFVRARTGAGPPWGTFAVNATGSLLLGLLTGLGLYHAFPETPRLVLGTGFCGAYTTFSTFTLDTVRLLEDGAVGQAFRYAFATLLVCTGAAGAGVALAAL
jgi:fluoride exporter